MEQPPGSVQSPTTAVVSSVVATITTSSCTSSNGSSQSNNAVVVGSSAATAIASSVILSNISAQQALSQQQQQQQQLFESKQEDANNLSLPSAMSESQRSISAAPSASSSPILSPPGKIFGRNANGTMIASSRPSNEAEVQLYRVLQRASLLAYYDTLLEMGGDDVQQLYEAGEEEFLEIMALVGMASKPLHVRRLQKALHEWANNPALFQGPMLSSSTGFCETITTPLSVYNPEPSTSSRSKFATISPGFNPTPLISTVQTSSQVLSQHTNSPLATPAVHQPPHQSAMVLTTPPSSHQSHHHPSGGATLHQVTSSSPQLTPVLTEMQVSRIALGAEKIARQLPQREPRAQTSKKRTSRELEQVIAMSENDPRRMDEIRKYAAIYGRFDCKRRPEKPLTLHEVCVNEAAAQLCRLVPALLTRRDELFPLARQIIKDAGFGHSASIARYSGLILAHTHAQAQRTAADCENTDSMSSATKRQRLPSTETISTPDFNRETMDDSRYNLFAMYQKFAKPPFDLSDIAKFSMTKSDYEDNDNDSRFSFSNSSTPPLPNNNSENERDFCDGEKLTDEAGVKSPIHQHHHHHPHHHHYSNSQPNQSSSNQQHHNNHRRQSLESIITNSPLSGGVQVISASGGHIIAVANPALAMSPALNEALSIKREVDSPEI